MTGMRTCNATILGCLCIFVVLGGCSKPTQPQANGTRCLPDTLSLGGDILAILPLSSQEVLYGTYLMGLYRFNEGEQCWSQLYIDQPDSSVCMLIRRANGQLFASTFSSGLFVSNDQGRTWTSLGLQGVLVRHMTFSSSGTIYVAGFWNGVFSSTDNGTSWSLSRPQGWHVTRSILLDGDSVIYVATNTGVFRSTNQGHNWHRSGLGDISTEVLVKTPSGVILAGTTNYGIFALTPTGSSWELRNEGLASRVIRSFAVAIDGKVVAGTSSSVSISRDDGRTWTEYPVPQATLGSIQSVAVEGVNTIYAGTPYDGAWKSSDNGQSWIKIGVPIISRQ